MISNNRAMPAAGHLVITLNSYNQNDKASA